jgi:hypothetical protein
MTSWCIYRSRNDGETRRARSEACKARSFRPPSSTLDPTSAVGVRRLAGQDYSPARIPTFLVNLRRTAFELLKTTAMLDIERLYFSFLLITHSANPVSSPIATNGRINSFDSPKAPATIASAPQEPTTHSAIDRESGSLPMCALSGRHSSYWRCCAP